MSQRKLKYTDALFFDAAFSSALEDRSREQIYQIIALIEQRRKMPEPGVWTFQTCLSIIKGSLGLREKKESKTEKSDALLMLANLLRQNPTPEVLRVFRTDIEQFVCREKCKIVFLLQEHTIWPAVEHLYRAAVADPRFEAQAVYVPFTHVNATEEDHSFERYRAEGVEIVSCDQYDLAAENPDVVVFTKPYEQIPREYTIREVEKLVKHTIYVPYGLELNKRLIKYGFQDYCHFAVWRHMAYGSVVKEYGTKVGYRNGENIAVWGHPRVDNYRKENLPAPDPAWQAKIRGRKVILWCPHHTIGPGPECVSTWVQNREAVFTFFEQHPEAVLLWRPHPLLFGAIVHNKYMTQEELDAFLAEKQAQENVILDQTPDYRTAFAMSDAIITDGTTFSLEYLLTGKPLLVTADSLEQFYQPEAMEEALSIGRMHEDIRRFAEDVLAGRDPKREKREAFTESLFLRPKDKSVSENILDNILLEIEDEIKRMFAPG